jgi:hypothetical protein
MTARVALPSEGVDLDGFLEKIENGFIQQALQRSQGKQDLGRGAAEAKSYDLYRAVAQKGMLQWTHHTPFSAAVVNHVTSTGAPLTEPAAKPWTPHSAAPADATKVGSLSF